MATHHFRGPRTLVPRNLFNGPLDLIQINRSALQLDTRRVA